jgi:hypothetical protein
MSNNNKPLLESIITAIDLYVVIQDDYKPLHGKSSSAIQYDSTNGRYVIHHVKYVQAGLFSSVLSTGVYNIELDGGNGNHGGKLIINEKTLVEYDTPRSMGMDVCLVILILAIFYYIVV